MRTFKDATGRSWDVVANVATLKRVKDMLGIDLARLDQDVMSAITDDPIALVDVLFVLCKPQADQREITDEAFGVAMAGNCIGEAGLALLEELVAFSPSPHRRAILTKAMVKQTELEVRGMTALEKYIDSDQPAEEMDKKIEEILHPTPGKSSTSSPAPSA